MKEYLANFLARDAIGDRTFHMHPNLGRSAKGCEHRECQHAAELEVQMRPMPEFAEARAGNPLLQWQSKVSGRFNLVVRTIGAEHLPP